MSNDESELERLLSLLAGVVSPVPPVAAEREAASKAMLALVILFAEGCRAELENTYAEVGGVNPRTADELKFSLKDPELWARTLEQFPDLKKRIFSQEHGTDTVGGFLKQQVEEVQLRRTGENVSAFRKPKD